MELTVQPRLSARGPMPLSSSSLSREAAHYRDRLGIPIKFWRGAEGSAAELGAHAANLHRIIVSRRAALPLWHTAELAALERDDLAALERTWRERLLLHPQWSAASGTLVHANEYADIWRGIARGDFAAEGRGGDYTRGMATFQASRWIGTRALTEILGMHDGARKLVLDVLGGDGYLWRVLQAERVLRGESDAGPLVVTNDISPHMFCRAGTWGMPTREDATQLSRTFAADAFDAVLFAYGTHHVEDLEAAFAEARRVTKRGGTIVVHDFIDEGPAGRWFHDVVDRHSKTGHDIPHVGPDRMASALAAAGWRDVELFEIDDPFVFAAHSDELDACEVATSYLLGMYGMEESFRGRRHALRQCVESTLTYPELGRTPLFSAGVVYIPRRAIVARARRAEA